MNYHDIRHCDMLNGSGLRVVLFVSGCDNKCKGCHNMMTWNPDSGVKFDQSSMNEIISFLKPSYISGLTISGGDPLYLPNLSVIKDIVMRVREEYGSDKSIWIYSGYQYEFLYNRDNDTRFILNNSDVLVDGKFIIDLKDDNLHYRGSKNQRIINLRGSSLDSIKILDL